MRDNTWETVDWKTERLVAPDGRILAEVADSYSRRETSVSIIGKVGYIGTYNTRENAKRAAEGYAASLPMDGEMDRKQDGGE